MLAHLGKLSHNDNNQRSERIGEDTNNSRERFEQSSLNGSPLSVGDVIDRYDLTDTEPSSNTAAFSSDWKAVAHWNGCDTTIELDSTNRRTTDEILEDELTAREQLLLEAGLDPAERRREVVA